MLVLSSRADREYIERLERELTSTLIANKLTKISLVSSIERLKDKSISDSTLDDVIRLLELQTEQDDKTFYLLMEMQEILEQLTHRRR